MSARARTIYLRGFTVRKLRIYARKQRIPIFMKWRKEELIAAIVRAQEASRNAD